MRWDSRGENAAAAIVATWNAAVIIASAATAAPLLQPQALSMSPNAPVAEVIFPLDQFLIATLLIYSILNYIYGLFLFI